MAVCQHTQDDRGRPCVSVSTHRTSVAVHQYTYQHAGPWTQRASPSRGLFGTFVVVRQHTQDFRGCPCVSVCPSAPIGRLWLSISTHIRTLVLEISTHTLPMDCSADFGQRGLSVQYTHDIRGCPSAHTGLPCVSVSTHRTSVAVCVCPVILATWPVCSVHTGHLWVSAVTHRMSVAVSGCPCVSVSTHRTSVAVHQYTYQHVVYKGRPWVSASTHRTYVAVRGCPSAHTGRPWLYVCVHVCPSAHTGRPSAHTGRLWLSISTHISTLVLGLSALALPVDCSGDFGPRGLSVQYTQDVRGCLSAHTQDVRGCPSAHTGLPWLSVCVCVCPSAPIGRLWLSISTDIRTLVLGISTHTLPMDCLADFGQCGLSFQYTHDIRGCPSAHTGLPCVSVSTHRTSVAVCVCLCVSVSTHRTSVSTHTHISTLVLGLSTDVCGCLWLSVCVHVCPSAHIERLWLSISTHISTLVLGISTHSPPVDCLADFGPRGLSVQYTKDVRGCPPAHTGRMWLSVAVRQHTQDVRGCTCASMCVRQHTQDVRQHTQDVRVCPSAHTGRLWLSLCIRSTHRMSVAIHQYTDQHYTQDVRGCLPAHRTFVAVHGCLSAHTGRLWLSVCVRQHTHDVRGCPSVHISAPCTHRTSVGVRQHTQDVCGCLSLHTGRPWLSVCVRVFPSAHIGRQWLSISKHISTLAFGISTHMFPMDCSADFGPRGLSVQYTHDIRGCPSAHTGRLCVSVSTHRTSVAVRVCPSAHTGRPWLSISTHISTLVLGLSTLALSVDCLGDFGPRGLFVQYTQDVRGCPPAHTGRPWLSVSTHRTSVAVRVCPSAHTGRLWLSVSTHRTSVCVRVCPSAHTGRLWLSISTHISTLVLRLSALALPVDYSGDFGPRGLSVQYTHDVRGCPSAHTGSPWVSVSTHRTSVALRVCPSAPIGRASVHISARWSLCVY
ncbi:hypothetical protein YC2023_108614 [Brassica napus]